MDAIQVKRLIDRIGPHIDDRYDHTYRPEFPAERTDVCAVRRLCENGSSYGYDTLYLVWEMGSGKLAYRRLTDTQSSKDYLNVGAIREEGDEIVLEYHSGGSFSGNPFQRTFRIKRSDLGLK